MDRFAQDVIDFHGKQFERPFQVGIVFQGNDLGFIAATADLRGKRQTVFARSKQDSFDRLQIAFRCNVQPINKFRRM